MRKTTCWKPLPTQAIFKDAAKKGFSVDLKGRRTMTLYSLNNKAVRVKAEAVVARAQKRFFPLPKSLRKINWKNAYAVATTAGGEEVLLVYINASTTLRPTRLLQKTRAYWIAEMLYAKRLSRLLEHADFIVYGENACGVNDFADDETKTARNALLKGIRENLKPTVTVLLES